MVSLPRCLRRSETDSKTVSRTSAAVRRGRLSSCAMESARMLLLACRSSEFWLVATWLPLSFGSCIALKLFARIWLGGFVTSDSPEANRSRAGRYQITPSCLVSVRYPVLSILRRPVRFALDSGAFQCANRLTAEVVDGEPPVDGERFAFGQKILCLAHNSASEHLSAAV